MYNFELSKAADDLMLGMFGVKKNENVVITCDTLSNMDVVEACAASVYKVGAFPTVMKIAAPDCVGKATDPQIPVKVLTGAIMEADVWLELNKQWIQYSSVYEYCEEHNKKLRYMCLVGYDAERMIRTISKVEREKLAVFMKATRDLHLKAKKMRITTPAGTDVHFELDHNNYFACDCGEANVPGMHMLTGQLNVVPKLNTVNGTIVYDGCIDPPFSRIPNTPVRLTVENSKIVAIDGGSEAVEFKKYLEAFGDPNMLKMAHVAYGFNTGAQMTGYIVEDERVWGCTEWGIGYVSPTDLPPYGQDAISHCDGLCVNSSVWLDDRQIMDEGKIVDPELKKLSPR